MVKLRTEKGGRDEMHRVAQLPSLPPLITSKMWAVPELSAVDIKRSQFQPRSQITPSMRVETEYKEAVCSN